MLNTEEKYSLDAKVGSREERQTCKRRWRTIRGKIEREEVGFHALPHWQVRSALTWTPFGTWTSFRVYNVGNLVLRGRKFDHLLRWLALPHWFSAGFAIGRKVISYSDLFSEIKIKLLQLWASECACFDSGTLVMDGRPTLFCINLCGSSRQNGGLIFYLLYLVRWVFGRICCCGITYSTLRSGKASVSVKRK